MQDFEPLLFQYWANVADGGPTLKQHMLNALCLPGNITVVEIPLTASGSDGYQAFLQINPISQVFIWEWTMAYFVPHIKGNPFPCESTVFYDVQNISCKLCL